jgi:dTDP-4-dehydrorhamnose reductase
MRKVLVIGVDSIIGANLACVLSRQMECLGLYHQYPVAPGPCLTEAAGGIESILTAVREFAPDQIVHCPVLARPAWDPPADDAIRCEEMELARRLADATSRLPCGLTVFSTDAVFTGPRLFHEESCVATGHSAHARGALRMEAELRDTHALIVRTCAYGWSPTGSDPGLAQLLATRLCEGQAANLDGLHYATPILASDLAALLPRAWERKLQGLYHITGAERTNGHRFASEMGQALGIESQPKSAKPSSEALARSPALETSLNTRRARRDLGCAMPLLREGLERFAAQRTSGYLDELRAAAAEPATEAKAA